MLELEKAKEEKKKIDERIVRLKNELASLEIENSNAGHQPAAPTQQGHGPQERPHNDEERVDASLENCDGRNEDEGRGEEDGEQQQQQQQQQSFGFQSLQQATVRNPNVQRKKIKHGGKYYRERHGTDARAMLATAASEIDAPPGSMVPVIITVQKLKAAPNYSNEDLIGACELYCGYAKEKGKPGKFKAVASAFENIPIRTIRKWAEIDPKTGLRRFEELRRAGAPTPEERMNGGKKSVLTQVRSNWRRRRAPRWEKEGKSAKEGGCE